MSTGCIRPRPESPACSAFVPEEAAMRRVSVVAMLCVLAGAGCHEPSTTGQVPTATSQPLPPLPPSGIVKPSGTVEERLVLAEDLAAKKAYAKAIEKVDEAI